MVNVPFPLDHFFFCFLPPVAAGACCKGSQRGEGGIVAGRAYHFDRCRKSEVVEVRFGRAARVVLKSLVEIHCG